MDQTDKIAARMRGSTQDLELAAHGLRRNPTPAEKTLWQALRNRQLAGLKFRRQHPLGPFILDFCCPARMLVVEVDGAAHDAQADYDDARTERLQAYGYQVLRFRNQEVLSDLPSVLERIVRVASERSPSPPLPRLGEGAGG